MRKMQVKFLIALWLAFFMGFITVAGQIDDTTKKHRGKKRHAELRKELKAYTDTYVLPVLREKRSTLESTLTLQDRQKLDELRKQLAVLKEQKKAFHQADGQTGKKELTEEQRAKKQEARKQIHAIMQQVKEIAKNYETAIAQALEPVKTQKVVWKQAMKAICEKYMAQKRDSFHTHRPDSMRQHHGHKHRKFHMMMKQNFKEMRPAMFLLIQPLGNETKTTAQEEKDESTKIYPNPASNQTTTIDFKVKEAGNVTIVLLDAQGNVVKQVANEHREKGKHSLVIDLTGLREGTYFYKITTPTKTETNRIVVK